MHPYNQLIQHKYYCYLKAYINIINSFPQLTSWLHVTADRFSSKWASCPIFFNCLVGFPGPALYNHWSLFDPTLRWDIANKYPIKGKGNTAHSTISNRLKLFQMWLRKEQPCVLGFILITAHVTYVNLIYLTKITLFWQLTVMPYTSFLTYAPRRCMYEGVRVCRDIVKGLHRALHKQKRDPL